MICTVDTSTTSQDDRIAVRLNDRCFEDPSTFQSTLSYGSCPNSQALRQTQTFDSNGATLFKLDVINVVVSLCIQVMVTHQDQSVPLCTYSAQLSFNPCRVAEIHSVSDSGVTVDISSSGEVPHGTVATFGVSSIAFRLIGSSQSICRNGQWDDLSERRSARKYLLLKQYVC